MRDTMTASTDQWMQQFYDQQPPLGKVDPMHEAPTRWDLGRVDAGNLTPASGETTNPTTLTMPSETTILSPTTNSYTSNTSQLTPKGNVSKPIRRRSRASKRTPTTLLNASTTNFRALVQQFTGCPSTTLSSSSSSSLGVHKGPITLNFQQGSKQVHHDHHHTTRVIPQFSSTSYNQAPAPFPWKKEPDQLLQQQQQQQNGYSFDHYVKSSSNFVPNSGNSSSSRPSSTSNMDISDGLLLVDNDFSLHDLI